MKTLNLVETNFSDINYTKVEFPDGQQNIILNVMYLTGEVQIKTRLNSFQDLELLICATKSLKNLGIKDIYLFVPYFLGSRSDRQFDKGSCNYLKDVVCPIINSLNFVQVKVMDAHSDVLEACLNNFVKEDNLNVAIHALTNIYTEKEFNKQNYILMSPDAGASKKIYKLAERLHYDGNINVCSKDRDDEGKLTKCTVAVGGLLDSKKDVIIIDDICDGGGTFLNIARELELIGFKKKLYLVVTHGIFSKGFKELSNYFNGIYCTNSYSDITDLGEINGGDFQFKQLNVF